MRRRDQKKRRPSRVWHRWLGFGLVIPLLFVAITGLLLNHVDELGWNEKSTDSGWVLSHYGMALEGDPVSYAVGGDMVSEWSGQLFWNGQALEVEGELIGAVRLTSGVAVVAPRAVHLFDTHGMLIETLDDASLPEGQFQKAGLDAQRRLVVRTAEAGDWTFSGDLLEFAISDQPPTSWSQAVSTPEAVRHAMETSYRGEGLTWSRILLDLHSGHFFGTVGRWLVDIFVILLVVLAITGLVVGIRMMSQGSNGQRPGQ